MVKVFIDGKEGTTGLRIFDRLVARRDIELITLPEELRKDAASRKDAINGADIVFLCLPDAAARESVSLCENGNTVIIDTSTAHRTDDAFAYGFPELSREYYEKIKSSKRIAVPGCHACGFISLVKPLVDNGIIKKDAFITCHSVTGYSGGGKKMIAQYESDERSVLLDAPRQYGLTQEHKHLKEMKFVAGLDNSPVFCPIVSDYYSGMVTTVPLFAAEINGNSEDIKNVYRSLYDGDIVKYTDGFGEDGFVSASGLCGKDSMNVTVSGNDERILLVSRFDNLGKGASGAALECMNIVLGCNRSEGLVL